MYLWVCQGLFFTLSMGERSLGKAFGLGLSRSGVYHYLTSAFPLIQSSPKILSSPPLRLREICKCVLMHRSPKPRPRAFYLENTQDKVCSFAAPFSYIVGPRMDLEHYVIRQRCSQLSSSCSTCDWQRAPTPTGYSPGNLKEC